MKTLNRPGTLATLIAALLVVSLAPMLQAQRPPAPRNPAPAPRPPPSTQGHSTARERQIEAGKARARQIREGERSGEGTSSPPAPSVPARPGRPDAPGRGERHPVDEATAAEFLAGLSERADRVKALRLENEILVLGGSTEKLRFEYVARRAPTGLVQHRVAIFDVTDSKETQRDIFLIHEFPGERSHGWHLGADGKVEPYDGDPLLYRVSTAVPLLLADLLPFDPGRYTLSHLGQGVFDGQPVAYVSAVPKAGRPDPVELTFHRFNRLALRGVVSRGDKALFEWSDSELRNRDGVPALERRKIVYPDERVVVVRTNARKIDPRIDPSLLDPSTFASH